MAQLPRENRQATIKTGMSCVNLRIDRCQALSLQPGAVKGQGLRRRLVTLAGGKLQHRLFLFGAEGLVVFCISVGRGIRALSTAHVDLLAGGGVYQ